MKLVRKLMSPDQFLDWRQDQPGRWELVSGVPTQMMAGAKQRHDQVVINLIVALGGRLRGGRCRPWSADIAVRIPSGNVRQPDVTVDCGPVRDSALEATTPTVVFEVLSPSTRTFDQIRKLDEYKTVPSMRHIVLIDPDRPRVLVWSRNDAGDGWADMEISAPEARVSLTGIAELTIAEIYQGVNLVAG